MVAGKLFRSTAFALGLAVAAPNGLRLPLRPAPEESHRAAVRPMREAAVKAIEEGALGEARRHLLRAATFLPEDPELLSALLESTEDPGARLHLAWAFLTAATGRRGPPALPRAWTDRFRDAPEAPARLAALARARAGAVEELLRFAGRTARDRRPGARLRLFWARDLLLELSRDAPALRAQAAETLAPLLEPHTKEGRAIVKALLRLARERLNAGDPGGAVEAARTAQGFCAQARFPHLKGPEPPDLDRERSEADDLLRKAREALASSLGEPLTIDRLEEMGTEERLRFTAEHDTFARPGVAWSAHRRYRVETICGFETLLGVARTVEHHHERLARWFGTDPFTDRPGVVRVVPEAADLEAEGAPFFWVGGFQSGDVTVVRLTGGDLAALGRTLTHELTHRFDGALHPGIPPWLVEGRAVWTENAYGRIRDTTFVENHCNFGKMEETLRLGYGDEEKLRSLISGKVEDYRDNYTAGYALYVYLATWPPEGRPIYAKPLAEYLRSFGGRKRPDPLDRFVELFCDGQEGRPATFGDFVEAFVSFLRGFYWLERADWTKAYTERVPPENLPLLLDAPAWQFSRRRAEPWFGERQAARAGFLLARHGKTADAVRALVFAAGVDEPFTARDLLLARLLERTGDRDAAWILRNDARLRSAVPALETPGPAPFRGALPRTDAFVEDLAEEAERFGGAHPDFAASLLGDALRLGRRLGIEPRTRTAAEPIERLPRHVAHLGLVEDELSGYDRHRVEGLFFEDDAGGIHVGRRKPREATGQLDRSAAFHHAFVRGREWLPPGRWRLRARISFTTTYADGAVVVGYTRRDRNIRLTFAGGDYLYSIGQKEGFEKLKAVDCSLDGLRDGEGTWAGQTAAKRFEFDPPRHFFDVEIVVDGATLVAYVDGEYLGAYHTPDGEPIQGYVGFACSFGAYRVDSPTVEPLDRRKALGFEDDATRGLTLGPEGSVERAVLLNRPTRGIPTGPEGTIVVWVPAPDAEDLESLEDEESAAFERRRRTYAALRSVKKTADALFAEGLEPLLVLAIPRFLDVEEERAKLAEGLAEAGVEVRIVVHEKVRTFVGKSGKPIRTELPTLLYVDPVGVLRELVPFLPTTSRLPTSISFHLAIDRGKARWLPERLLAETVPPSDQSPRK